MRVIDLSAPIEPSPPDTPEFLRTEISFSDHAQGARDIEALMGVPTRLLRDEEGWAVEEFQRFGTHNSTHVDAPWHYNSHVGGRRAQTIDELPLEWFYNPGVVLDFSGRADGECVEAEDLEPALDAAAHVLAPGDIVLIRTGCDEHYGQPDYILHGPGVSAGATHWLFDRGVRVMGIDAWGWDAPLHLQAREAVTQDAAGVFWAAHQADLPYCQIERLCNLGKIPASGFLVACFPLRIVGASAGPTRAVAILPD
jgi:kynurenine formamidase